MVVVAVLLLGCKDKQEKLEQTKDKVVDVAGGAKDKLVAAKDKVVEVTGDVLEKAIEKGKAAKVELDKAYKSDNEYDLAVDDIGSEQAAIHASRLEKMPSIEVNGVRVGYEEDSNLSLRGTTYAKHFRMSWKRGDKIVRVSFYSKQTIDIVELTKLIAKIVPAVEFVLK